MVCMRCRTHLARFSSTSYKKCSYCFRLRLVPVLLRTVRIYHEHLQWFHLFRIRNKSESVFNCISGAWDDFNFHFDVDFFSSTLLFAVCLMRVRIFLLLAFVIKFFVSFKFAFIFRFHFWSAKNKIFLINSILCHFCWFLSPSLRLRKHHNFKFEKFKTLRNCCYYYEMRCHTIFNFKRHRPAFMWDD